MARRDIELWAGEYYHFYNRGHNRELIFYEPDNYLFFLDRLRKYPVPVLDVVAYCLMPTHYHLLARIKQNQTEQQTSEVSLMDGDVFGWYTLVVVKGRGDPVPLWPTYHLRMNSHVTGGQQSNTVIQRYY